MPARFSLLVFSSFFILISCQPWSYRPNDDVQCGPEKASPPCGPANWADLGGNECGAVGQQSPVDLVPVSSGPSPQLQPLKIVASNPCDQATLLQREHSMEIQTPSRCLPSPAGTPPQQYTALDFSGQRMYLHQLHLHTPSEHRINGKLFDAELHLIFKGQAGLLVVGLLFEPGHRPAGQPASPNAWLDGWFSKGFSQQPVVHDVLLDVRGVVPKDGKYWHYNGSLTTPPCSTGVRWVVMDSPLSISALQLNTLQQLCSNTSNTQAHKTAAGPVTSRPLQPLGTRSILTYQDNQRSSSHWMLLIIVAAGLVVMAVAIICLSKGKNREQQPPQVINLYEWEGLMQPRQDQNSPPGSPAFGALPGWQLGAQEDELSLGIIKPHTQLARRSSNHDHAVSAAL